MGIIEDTINKQIEALVTLINELEKNQTETQAVKERLEQHLAELMNQKKLFIKDDSK